MKEPPDLLQVIEAADFFEVELTMVEIDRREGTPPMSSASVPVSNAASVPRRRPRSRR